MLTYSSMPQEAKILANANLGRGVLRSIFTRNYERHLTMKIEDGKIIGFAVYHFEEAIFGGKVNIKGVIDCVLVDEAHRRMGHGSDLTFALLKKMSAYGVNRVEVLIKQPGYQDRDGEPGVPLASPSSILNVLGFTPIKTFHGYYESPSERFSYECKFCGNMPDSCKAVLYARDS